MKLDRNQGFLLPYWISTDTVTKELKIIVIAVF